MPHSAYSLQQNKIMHLKKSSIVLKWNDPVAAHGDAFSQNRRSQTVNENNSSHLVAVCLAKAPVAVVLDLAAVRVVQPGSAAPPKVSERNVVAPGINTIKLFLL